MAYEMNVRSDSKWVIRGIVVGAIFLFVLAMGSCSYTGVKTGDVAVTTTFGGKVAGELQPGVYFLPPWYVTHRFSTRFQSAKFFNPRTDDEKKNPKDYLGTISASSRESQDVYFDVTLNWAVDPSHVTDLYSHLGDNYFQVLVPSRMNQYFKAETVKYEATEALRQREKIRTDVSEALAKDLAQFGILVSAIQIDNVDFNAEFKKAIEDKQVKTQQAAAAVNEVAIAEARAKTTIATAAGAADSAIQTARGAAESIKLGAAGEAEAIRLRSQAQAEGNRLLNASLTPALIDSQRIAKWNGSVPQLVTGSSGGTILDLGNVIR